MLLTNLTRVRLILVCRTPTTLALINTSASHVQRFATDKRIAMTSRTKPTVPPHICTRCVLLCSSIAPRADFASLSPGFATGMPIVNMVKTKKKVTVLLLEGNLLARLITSAARRVPTVCPEWLFVTALLNANMELMKNSLSNSILLPPSHRKKRNAHLSNTTAIWVPTSAFLGLQGNGFCEYQITSGANFMYLISDAIVSLIVPLARTKKDATIFPFPVQRICLDVRTRCVTSTFRGSATDWPTVQTVPISNLHSAQLLLSLPHPVLVSKIRTFTFAQLMSLYVPADNASPWNWCVMVIASVRMALMRGLVAVS